MPHDQEKSAPALPAEESRNASAASAAEAPPEPSELEQAIAARDQALERQQELLEKLQRAQAEFENTRKRLLKEQADIREYAAMGVIDSLLPIVDDFERALATPTIDPDLRKGLELIRDRVVDVFKKAGLEPIEAEGYFDPNLHQAVDRGVAETDEDDQKILDVYRQGYRFKERLLRPAMVKVAVKE